MRSDSDAGRDAVRGRRRQAPSGRKVARGAELKSAALRMLMRVAGDTPYEPASLTGADATICRLLRLGASERDIRNALGCSRDELVAALWRIAN